MNLAPLMGCTNKNIPFPGGYVQANSVSVNEWRRLLQRKPQHQLIALHWQGNSEHEHSLYSRGRSLPFDAWLELRNNNQVEFVSIQKGQASKQLKTDQGLNFVRGQEAVSKSMDFRETAAVVANCDLVITSDSSVAHLAGAMEYQPGLPYAGFPSGDGDSMEQIRLGTQACDYFGRVTMATGLALYKQCVKK